MTYTLTTAEYIGSLYSTAAIKYPSATKEYLCELCDDLISAIVCEYDDAEDILIELANVFGDNIAFEVHNFACEKAAKLPHTEQELKYRIYMMVVDADILDRQHLHDAAEKKLDSAYSLAMESPFGDKREFYHEAVQKVFHCSFFD